MSHHKNKGGAAKGPAPKAPAPSKAPAAPKAAKPAVPSVIEVAAPKSKSLPPVCDTPVVPTEVPNMVAEVALIAPEVAAAPVEVPVVAEAPEAPVQTPAAEVAAPVAEVIEDTVQEGIETMTNETIEQVQAGQAAAADRFQATFTDMNERTRNVMDKGTKFVEEMTDLTRGNVEALVASSKAAARGVETLSQEAADYSRRSFEEASATLKSFAEVRSPTDFFKLQSEYARSAFDSWVSESSKTTEQMIKLAGEVAQPLTSRYAVAAERVKTIAS